MVGRLTCDCDHYGKVQQMREQMKASNTDGIKGLSKEEIGALSEKLKENGKEQTPLLDRLQENFDSIDRNSNGQISKGEFHSAMKSENGLKLGHRKAHDNKPETETISSESSTTTEDTVIVQEGDNDSPITVDENGNTVFQTVIRLDAPTSGTNEITPILNESLLSPEEEIET